MTKSTFSRVFNSILIIACLLLFGCSIESKDHVHPVSPGSTAYDTIKSSFLYRDNIYFVTNNLEIYSINQNHTQIIHTLDATLYNTLYFSETHDDGLLCFNNKSLFLWTPENNETPLCDDFEFPDDSALLGVAGDSAIFSCNDGCFLLNYTTETSTEIDSDIQRILTYHNSTLYVTLDDGALAAIDLETGKTLSKLEHTGNTIAACCLQDKFYYLNNHSNSLYVTDLTLTEAERIELPTHKDGKRYGYIGLASDNDAMIIISHLENTEINTLQFDPNTNNCTHISYRDGHYSVPGSCYVKLQNSTFFYYISTEPISSFTYGKIA